MFRPYHPDLQVAGRCNIFIEVLLWNHRWLQTRTGASSHMTFKTTARLSCPCSDRWQRVKVTSSPSDLLHGSDCGNQGSLVRWERTCLCAVITALLQHVTSSSLLSALTWIRWKRSHAKRERWRDARGGGACRNYLWKKKLASGPFRLIFMFSEFHSVFNL